MKPQNLKELTKLIQILKKNGVESFKFDGFEIVLSESDKTKRTYNKKSIATQLEDAELNTTKEWSSDDTLFWSSSTAPDESSQ